MEYQIEITRKIENPNLAEEMKEYRDRVQNGFGYSRGDVIPPTAYTEEKTLSVEISQEQFEAIRKAVLEKF